jgi:hypothetical protein
MNMNFVKSLVILVLAAGFLLAVEHKATAAKGQVAGQVTGLRIAPVSDAAITAPIRSIYGRVKSIAGRVLLVDVDGRDMTFMVDDNTDVLARGAGHATRNAGGSLPIADLVHNGDIVRVAYRELNGWMRVLEIQVRGRSTIAAR